MKKLNFELKSWELQSLVFNGIKDDLELFTSERLDIKEEDEGSHICLKDARLSDSGVIKCVASNMLGRAVTTSQLIIETPPRFDVPENYQEGLIFRQDELIRLKVGIVGKPAPKIVWFFEDEPITQGSDLSIETLENYTAIRIPEAKRWHCGEFRCYAENENGEDAISILVTVTSPPASPSSPVVIDITETRCTLRWDPPDDDGGADVKHYIIEYFRDVWDVWLKAQTSKETQAVIHDLIPGSRYKFRIKAENVYGLTNDRAQDFAPSLPPAPIDDEPLPKTRKNQILQETKRAWDSIVPSYDSDGIPSISSVDIPDDSSVSSGSQKHPYAQSSTENPPDMETVSEIDPGDYEKAKKLFEELKQISSQTGIGSVDNLMESLHSSQENLSSLIPPDKMSELNKFEMTLKDMIEEARMIADEADKNDRNKSASVQSIAETIPSDSCHPYIPLQRKVLSRQYEDLDPIAPSTTKRITDSSLPRVSQYDEIIMSRRNSLNENSILTSSRGNSLPPPLDDGYTRSSTTPLLLTSATMPKKSSSPSPAQQRPLTMSNNKLHKKSTEKRDGQTLKMESMQGFMFQ
ncbi:TTN [Lepeophtheirus salmonis]|uniref:TTN n=1 Tax=Lepeophtheirus salmonis TaxID=72036 RepID=A0A7R8CNK4_LEPSM|nr:TTN [Lepeophtheirus salmonis]CAF2830546.1 TTN [Lepeophtheirus salmonis]